MQTVQKVVAYITRVKNGRQELLVNVHRDFPEAGVQVPSGTVEPGEEIVAALWRETEEESGLTADDVTLVKSLGRVSYLAAHKGQLHERHVFHLAAARNLPDTWVHEDHHAEGETVVLDYYWVPVTEAELVTELGELLLLI